MAPELSTKGGGGEEGGRGDPMKPWRTVVGARTRRRARSLSRRVGWGARRKKARKKGEAT